MFSCSNGSWIRVTMTALPLASSALFVATRTMHNNTGRSDSTRLRHTTMVRLDKMVHNPPCQDYPYIASKWNTARNRVSYGDLESTAYPGCCCGAPAKMIVFFMALLAWRGFLGCGSPEESQKWAWRAKDSDCFGGLRGGLRGR